MVQGLRLRASTAGAAGSIPSGGSSAYRGVRPKKKKKLRVLQWEDYPGFRWARCNPQGPYKWGQSQRKRYDDASRGRSDVSRSQTM